MTDHTICEIAIPASPDITPSWVAQQTLRIEEDYAVELLGAPDFHDGFPSWCRNYANQEDYVSVNLVAVRGVDASALPTGRVGLPQLSWDAAVEQAPAGEVLGLCGVAAPLKDNLHLADLWLTVPPQHRGHGVGTALLAAAEDIATQQWGRRTIAQWRSHEVPASDDERLVPGTGVGAIARDGAARFLQRHGYVLEQCERHSVCELPTDTATLDRLWADSLPKAEGYTLRHYVDRTPDDLLDAACAMLRHFTVEAPSGGMELEEEDWTPERLRRGEDRRIANGRRTFGTVAIHDASGQMAAATEVSTSPEHSEVVFQQVTIVDSGHRGHRLGWLVKIANVRQLEAADPGRRRIHTWNAGENQWMLAINDAMGFKERLTEGAWQKKVG